MDEKLPEGISLKCCQILECHETARDDTQITPRLKRRRFIRVRVGIWCLCVDFFKFRESDKKKHTHTTIDAYCVRIFFTIPEKCFCTAHTLREYCSLQILRTSVVGRSVCLPVCLCVCRSVRPSVRPAGRPYIRLFFSLVLHGQTNTPTDWYTTTTTTTMTYPLIRRTRV